MIGLYNGPVLPQLVHVDVDLVVTISITSSTIVLASSVVSRTIATLALGSGQRQGLKKVQGESVARESHSHS